MANDGEVVRDEEQPDVEVACEIREEVRELGLRGCVERGERLVEDDHRRVGCERACDRHALPLSAGELVRVARRRTRRKADDLAELADASLAHRPRPSSKRVSDLRAGRASRVERRVRVLKDELQPNERLRPRAPRQRRHVGSLESHDAARQRREADSRARERRLAASRLADEADHSTPLDGDARTGDCPDAFAAAALVLDDDVV
ncbi:MAG TPA: hypothetical protein VGG88_10405 [Gaiellaceae bacterium]